MLLEDGPFRGNWCDARIDQVDSDSCCVITILPTDRCDNAGGYSGQTIPDTPFYSLRHKLKVGDRAEIQISESKYSGCWVGCEVIEVCKDTLYQVWY